MVVEEIIVALPRDWQTHPFGVVGAIHAFQHFPKRLDLIAPPTRPHEIGLTVLARQHLKAQVLHGSRSLHVRFRQFPELLEIEALGLQVVHENYCGDILG